MSQKQSSLSAGFSRREFLAASPAAAFGGVTVPAAVQQFAPHGGPKADAIVMNDLTLMKWARNAGLEKGCRRKYRITCYEPCHIRYQFGHYPTRKPYAPTGEDWRLLDLYAQWGGGVINLWYWNEWAGLFGKSVFEAINERGALRFVEEAHKRGLKVVPYVSPGYLDVQNVQHRPEWSRNTSHLVELANDFDLMCPGSTAWREYFFGNLAKMLDHYGFDGVYWDGGIGAGRPGCSNNEATDHVHFSEMDPNRFSSKLRPSPEELESFYALWEDLLAQMYSIVKQRNGVIIAHFGGDLKRPFEQQWWDYQLLGEGIPDILASVDRTRDYDPYIVRFNDWSQMVTHSRERDLTPDKDKVPVLEHLSMAGSIVYLQFPWLEDGCYGEIEDMFTIPGTRWKQEYDHWTEWMKAQKKAGLAPLGNSSWIAGRDRYAVYLKVYRQLTQENSLAFIELNELDNAPFPVSSGSRRVTVFINDSLWVAIANMGQADEKATAKALDGTGTMTITMKAGRLTVLRYRNVSELPEEIPIM